MNNLLLNGHFPENQVEPLTPINHWYPFVIFSQILKERGILYHLSDTSTLDPVVSSFSTHNAYQIIISKNICSLDTGWLLSTSTGLQFSIQERPATLCPAWHNATIINRNTVKLELEYVCTSARYTVQFSAAYSAGPSASYSASFCISSAFSSLNFFTFCRR